MATHEDIQIAIWIADHPDRRVHPEGCIVLSPPGSGKTTFVELHPADWVDVDEVLGADGLGIHTEQWHDSLHSEAEEKAHYMVCDKYLSAMRRAGLWAVGSLFEAFVPDYIVFLKKQTHYDYVKQRSDLKWPAVQDVTLYLQDLADKHPTIAVLNSWAALQSGKRGRAPSHELVAGASSGTGHVERAFTYFVV